MTLSQYRKQIVTRAAVLLAILMVGSGVILPFPASVKVVLGLCAGGVTSLAVFWLKVKDALRAVEMHQRRGLGLMVRGHFLGYGAMMAVLLACVLIPQVNVWAAAAGLFLSNVVIIASAACQQRLSLGKNASG